MQIKGAFKCPQCQGEFDKCRPSGPERIWALCIRCDIIVILEDYNHWMKRMKKFKQNSQFGHTVVSKIEDCEKAKEDWKGKLKKVFNPTKR